jgi:hypothetical protein
MELLYHIVSGSQRWRDKERQRDEIQREERQRKIYTAIIEARM